MQGKEKPIKNNFYSLGLYKIVYKYINNSYTTQPEMLQTSSQLVINRLESSAV